MRLLLKVLGILLLLTLVSLSVQYEVVEYYRESLYYSVFAVYGFHFGLTLLITLALYAVFKQAPAYVGYAFLASSALRMLASIVFLIPLMRTSVAHTMPDILSFMIPYFVYLIFEACWAILLMNFKNNK